MSCIFIEVEFSDITGVQRSVVLYALFLAEAFMSRCDIERTRACELSRRLRAVVSMTYVTSDIFSYASISGNMTFSALWSADQHVSERGC